jgi:hypothetical protein
VNRAEGRRGPSSFNPSRASCGRRRGLAAQGLRDLKTRIEDKLRQPTLF